jgi:CheY-like chemotaxis protein
LEEPEFGHPFPLATAEVAVIGSDTGTVLVVEDETVVRLTVARALRRVGYSVLEAGNGPDAITRSDHSAAPIDLILADVLVSGLNSHGIVDTVHLRHPEARVLYMSRYPRDVISNMGVLHKGLSFIERSEFQNQLVHRIRHLLIHGHRDEATKPI